MHVTYDPMDSTERVMVEEINQVFENSEAAWDAAQALEEVDGEAIEMIGGEAIETIGGEVEDELLRTFLDNVGNGWEFIRLGAEHFGPDEEFGFAELSSRSEVPVETLKAYHRNLGRTARSIGQSINDVIPSRWDGSRVLYRIPPALHAEATE